MTAIKRVDYLAKAQAAWGEALPVWVAELAREADRTSGADAARKIGCSAPVVTYVIANKYGASLDRIKARVEGALMGATVVCPARGEIGRDYCLSEQAMGNTMSSPMRGLVYRNCRGIGVPLCKHSYHKPRGS